VAAITGIASAVCTGAAAGILAALLFAPFGELRRFFFAFNAGLALAFLALSMSFRPLPFATMPDALSSGAGRPAGVATLAALVLVLAYVACLYRRGGRECRGMLVLAAAAALAATAMDGAARAAGPATRVLFAAAALSSAALLGTVIVAMLLGHWYLVRRGLPVGHLVGYARLLAGVLGLRGALLVAGLLMLGAGDAGGMGAYLRGMAVDRGFFFWTRVFFGLLGPAVLTYMVHETARIRSTQSATGILYIEVIFVLIGELLAHFLAIAAGGPL